MHAGARRRPDQKEGPDGDARGDASQSKRKAPRVMRGASPASTRGATPEQKDNPDGDARATSARAKEETPTATRERSQTGQKDNKIHEGSSGSRTRVARIRTSSDNHLH